MRGILATIAILGCGGCMETHLGKGRPGESIFQENTSISWMPAGLSGGKAGMRNWVLVRVIAPKGARKCVSGSLSPLISGGPQAEGKPDSEGVVMLTSDPKSLTVHVRCETPAGDISRSVDGYRYEKYYKITDRVSRFNIPPPMIHMDPADPQIAARWENLRAEICSDDAGPQAGFLCRPEIFDVLKSADMATASDMAATPN